MTIRDKMQQATNTPRTDIFAEFIILFQNVGFNTVPEKHWDTLAELLYNTEEEFENGMTIGPFTVIENHLRSQSHQEWATSEGNTVAPNTWIIPFDELICLHLNDKNAMDFVTLTRLVFTGNEEELNQAIELLKTTL